MLHASPEALAALGGCRELRFLILSLAHSATLFAGGPQLACWDALPRLLTHLGGLVRA